MTKIQNFLNQFIQKYENKAVDFDNYYGHQCVDLANQYRLEITGLNPNQGVHLGAAAEIFENPEGFFNSATRYEKIANDFNDPNQVPNAGDIIVWDSSMGGGYGHIAIVIEGNTDNFTVLEQNTGNGDGEGQDDVTKKSTYANYAGVQGWLRILLEDEKLTPQKFQTNETKQDLIDYTNFRLEFDEATRSDIIRDINQGNLKDIIGNNAGIRGDFARFRTDNNYLTSENIANLEGKSKAEELVRQKNSIIHKLEIDLKNSQESHSECKNRVENQAVSIEDLLGKIKNKQGIIEKQGEILNSKPMSFDWVKGITGQLSVGSISSIVTNISLVLGIIQSNPQFASENPWLIGILAGLTTFVRLAREIINLIENKK